MPAGTDNIVTKPGSEDEARVKEAGYKESLGPQTKESGKFPFNTGMLVKGRSARVGAKAPKEETQSSPVSGSLFEPDKSENYGIRDVAPADRKP
jgi:hypothetical protein